MSNQPSSEILGAHEPKSLSRWLTPLGLMAAFLLGTGYGVYSGLPAPDQWDWFDTFVTVVLLAIVIVCLALAFNSVREDIWSRQNDPFPLGIDCGKCGKRHKELCQ